MTKTSLTLNQADLADPEFTESSVSLSKSLDSSIGAPLFGEKDIFSSVVIQYLVKNLLNGCKSHPMTKFVKWLMSTASAHGYYGMVKVRERSRFWELNYSYTTVKIMQL